MASILPGRRRRGPAGKSKAYVSLSKGWALGSVGFKATLIHDHALAARARAWESQGAKEIRQEQWRRELERCLRVLGKTVEDNPADLKSADWKVAIAAHLKQKTQASNGWLCDQLHMGTPVGVSQMVGILRRKGGASLKWLKQLI